MQQPPSVGLRRVRRTAAPAPGRPVILFCFRFVARGRPPRGGSFETRLGVGASSFTPSAVALYLSVRQGRARKCRRTHIYSYYLFFSLTLLRFVFIGGRRVAVQGKRSAPDEQRLVYASQHVRRAREPNEQYACSNCFFYSSFG